MLPYLKTGVKIVYPYGKLSNSIKMTVLQFIIIEYQSLQNVNNLVDFCKEFFLQIVAVVYMFTLT